MLIALCIAVCYIFLSSSITKLQSTPSYAIYLREILILYSHLRVCFPCGLFPSDFLTKAIHFVPLFYVSLIS